MRNQVSNYEEIIDSMTNGMREIYACHFSCLVKERLREVALDCRYTGGNVPFGYSVDCASGKFIIDESEASVIRLIFEMTLQGYSNAEILTRLSDRGAKTRRGNDFATRALLTILRNEKYAGVYLFHSSASDETIRIPGGMPRIVDTDIFDAVQIILNARIHSHSMV